MNKLTMAVSIIESPAWDGTNSINEMLKLSKTELKSMYDYIEDAEQDYYNNLYN